MIVARIKDANRFPGAPQGWNEAEGGPCGVLPVRCDGETCESAWKPTPEELAKLNAGGHVILRVWGWQVPVAVYAADASQAVPWQPPHMDCGTA